MGSYLKIALRLFRRDVLYSLINITGLAIGIASCVICYLHIDYELSYDTQHSKKDRIYRLITGDIESKDYWVMMAPPIPPELKNRIPEVEDFVRIGRLSWDPKALVKYGEKSFFEDRFLLADPSFFRIFDFNLIHDSRESVLSDINSAVITRSNAEKYFGDENPIGKTIDVDNKYQFMITGVIEDPPFNSHLEFDFLISFENISRIYGEGAPFSWGSYNYYAFLLLSDKAEMPAVSEKIAAISVELESGRNISFESLVLEPLTDIHFQDNRGNQKASYNIIYLYIFIAIALAVLLIASINFINLTTARSERRIREVGLRKTVGALRRQLIFQFVTEAVIITLFAMLIANLIITLFLPQVNYVLESQINMKYDDPVFMLVLTGIVLIIGILSGSYIAFYISSFRPYEVLKGLIKVNKRDVSLRKVLLVFQFTVSTLLIICSIIILRQLKYVHEMDIGLDQEHVVNISVFGEEAQGKISLFKDEIRQSPLILSAAASSFVPGRPNFHQTVWWEGQQNSSSMFIIPVDKDFVETMRIELSEGEIEKLKMLQDSSVAYILNESAREFMGVETAEGILFSGFGQRLKRPVMAVVEDFNYSSLHHEIAPVVLAVGNRMSHDQVSVRIAPGQIKDALIFLELTFKEVMPSVPFEFEFMDENFEELYASENKAGKIIGFLTILSVVIALFGIYALGAFAIQERTREIAIRKVNGISGRKLILILTRQFLILMLIGNIIAWPFAWKLMKDWLQNFTYRISLGAEIFILATLLTLLTVFLVVSIKAIQATRLNPADSLRYE